ncbi:MAG: pirin family protein [Xanthomonadaceae bacterium]|nr:pirin family protein [Xanthomonadaceae bacterium]
MLQIRGSDERGFADHGWLKAKHSFSFADYYDPSNMGFRGLRVMNEDRIDAAQGFGTHPHRDMEIITVILKGALEHKDSMGTGSVIKPGDVQYMSAGSGVLHSEFNHSKEESAHLYQIWILPNERGAKPRYAQTHFTREHKLNKLCLVASPDGREGSIAIRANAKLYSSILDPGKDLSYRPEQNRGQWVQIIRGELSVNGKTVREGDGVSIWDVSEIELKPIAETEILLFDLE